jgi:hypothetical protein
MEKSEKFSKNTWQGLFHFIFAERQEIQRKTENLAKDGTSSASIKDESHGLGHAANMLFAHRINSESFRLKIRANVLSSNTLVS